LALRSVAGLMSTGDTTSTWTVAGKSGRKENVVSNKQMANGGDEGRRWPGPKSGPGGGRRIPRTEPAAPRGGGGSGAADVNSLRDAVAHARSGTGEVKQAIVSATFAPRAPCYTALIQQCARTKSWCAARRARPRLCSSQRCRDARPALARAGKRRWRCSRQCARRPASRCAPRPCRCAVRLTSAAPPGAGRAARALHGPCGATRALRPAAALPTRAAALRAGQHHHILGLDRSVQHIGPMAGSGNRVYRDAGGRPARPRVPTEHHHVQVRPRPAAGCCLCCLCREHRPA